MSKAATPTSSGKVTPGPMAGPAPKQPPKPPGLGMQPSVLCEYVWTVLQLAASQNRIYIWVKGCYIEYLCTH